MPPYPISAVCPHHCSSVCTVENKILMNLPLVFRSLCWWKQIQDGTKYTLKYTIYAIIRFLICFNHIISTRLPYWIGPSTFIDPCSMVNSCSYVNSLVSRFHNFAGNFRSFHSLEFSRFSCLLYSTHQGSNKIYTNISPKIYAFISCLKSN